MPSELERVLAALDSYADDKSLHGLTCAEGARLLREMARDFHEYADHGFDERGSNCPKGTLEITAGGYARVCSCGLDAARARWRLSE